MCLQFVPPMRPDREEKKRSDQPKSLTRGEGPRLSGFVGGRGREARVGG